MREPLHQWLHQNLAKVANPGQLWTIETTHQLMPRTKKTPRKQVFPEVFQGRGDPRLTLVNETAEVHLALSLFPRTLDFPADVVLELVEPGLYKRGR